MNPRRDCKCFPPTLETGQRTEPHDQAAKSRPDGRDRRRARHQGRIAREDLHRRSAGARPTTARSLPGTAAASRSLDIRPQGTVVVVRFKGIGDRSAAEALTGTELFVDRAALPDDWTTRSSTTPTWSAWRSSTSTARGRQGRRRAEFRRRRHSRDPLAGAARACWCRSPRPPSHGRSCRRDDPGRPVAAGLVDDDDGRRPGARRRATASTRSGRPRGPRDAGGNR